MFFAPLVATAFEQAGVNDSEVETVRPSAEDRKQEASAELSASGDKDDSPQGAPSKPVIGMPGLGTFGVIPNLDLGMEFLYGQEKKQVEETSPEEDEDSLQIRGTIKHRF